MPCRNVGTHISTALMSVALKCAPMLDAVGFCSECAAMMDTVGDHVLVCPCACDRVERHHALRNFVLFASKSAGFTPELERPPAPVPLGSTTLHYIMNGFDNLLML